MAKAAINATNDTVDLVNSSEVNFPAELEGYSGYEDFDSNDLIIPRVKIVQPTSRKGTAGKFLMNLTDEEFSSMDIIVIKATRSRVLWGDDLEAQEPLCKSSNFLVPDASIEEPISLACAIYTQKGDLRVLDVLCEKAKWINNERPDCNQSYNLLCLTGEHVPFWISLSGASISPVKRFISAIALRRKKLWQFGVTISTEERIKPNRHYTIRFGPPQPLEAAQLHVVADLVASLKDQTARLVQDQDTDVSVQFSNEVPF